MVIMKGSTMLKIEMEVNDVIQASKNKNASVRVSSLI